jgi:carboxypeptidase family protein
MVWLGACTGSPSGLHNGATFSGTLSSSQGGTIANATITVTPSGGSALAGVQTDGSGAYTVDGVPAGDGSITVSNVPSNCQAPSALPYSGAKNGGHSVHNLTAPCGSTTLP